MSLNIRRSIAPTIHSVVRHQSQSQTIPSQRLPPDHSCGIPPWPMPKIPPPPPPPAFPAHLLRPPCLPGQEAGRFPPTCHHFKGYYCPVTRQKYIYPAFSDNIDFTPTGGIECWWTRAPLCEFLDMEQNLPLRL